MRVNLDESSYNDARFRRLARLMGCSVDDAIGRVARLWLAALNRVDERNPEGLLRRADAEDSTDYRDLVDRVLEVDLATTRRGGLIYFAGLKERAKFLLQQREKGRTGGRPRKDSGSSKAAGYEDETRTETPGSGIESLPSGSGSGSGSSLPSEEICPVSPDGPVLVSVPKQPDRSREVLTAHLEWFNRTFDRRFTPNDELRKMVKALLAKGYSDKPDMRGVAMFLKGRWEGKPDMAEYLKPDSILRPSKFAIRLDEAREMHPEWWARKDENVA